MRKIPTRPNSSFGIVLLYLVSLLFFVNHSLAFVCCGRGMSSFQKCNAPTSCSLSSSSSSSPSPTMEMTKVELYSTLGCKHCRKAKAILNKFQVPYIAVDIENYREVDSLSTATEQRKQRSQHAFRHTIPQIYLQDTLLGGCNDLEQSIASKDFFKTCDRLGISYKIPTSADGNKAMQDAEDGVAYELKGHVDTYLNNDSIMSIDDDGNKVNEQKVIFQISVNLQKTALTLMDNFANDEGTSINYKSMRRSAEFREYVNIASQLRQVSLSAIGAMSEKKRLSFFANLYNSLILHATCVLGAPENTPQGRSAFFSGDSGAVYNLGGHMFTPDIIEHGILRANTRHPYQQNDFPNYLKSGDPIASVALTPPLDPRIHFILNCGAKSCPPIKILPENPEEGLQMAAASYISSELSINSMTKTIHVPKLAFWYEKDFGSDALKTLQKLISLLHDETRVEFLSSFSTLFPGVELMECDELPTGCEIKYNEYIWDSNGVE